MPHRLSKFRLMLAAGTALAALPAFAQAQSAPPATVGQVSYVTGSVSFNGAGSNGQWVAAQANYPVTTGDSLFTQAGGETAVAVDASRLTLAGNTELQITSLDDTNFAATETQGELFLNIVDLQPGQNLTITTQGGAVNITEDGQYDILAGDSSTPPTITVLAGAATVGGVQVPAGQAAALLSAGPQLQAAARDGFIDHVLAELAPPPPPYVPPVVVQMTGVSELSSYGSWDQNAQYGAVWYPSVSADWAPYREGHWAYVAPWGWTWVDNEPWGFAPFHYGRWIHNDDRWGWVADSAYQEDDGERDERPVYAPAMVTFFGAGLAVGITAEALSHGSVGWVPLAPGEVYHPSYHADDDYIRRLNRGDVRNINVVDIHYTTIINNYANRAGATYVPADAISHGEQVAHYARPVDPAVFAHARPLQTGFNQEIRPAAHLESERVVPPPEVHREAFHLSPGQAYHPPAGGTFRPASTPGARPEAPNAMRPQAVPARPGAPEAYHPEAPGMMRPPAPPAYHPEAPRPEAAPTYRPEAAPAYHTEAPAYRPEAPAYHPAAPAYHPAAPAYHPEAPAYHPEAPAYHPEAPAYHPAAPAYRPEAPAYHPEAPAYHPEAAPRPEAPPARGGPARTKPARRAQEKLALVTNA